MEVETIIASKGGGETVVRICLDIDDFGPLLRTMSETHRQTAMEAMTAEVHHQVSGPPNLTEMVLQETYNVLKQEAATSWARVGTEEKDQKVKLGEGAQQFVERMKNKAPNL